jgi:hypothetical protein
MLTAFASGVLLLVYGRRHRLDRPALPAAMGPVDAP